MTDPVTFTVTAYGIVTTGADVYQRLRGHAPKVVREVTKRLQKPTRRLTWREKRLLRDAFDTDAAWIAFLGPNGPSAEFIQIVGGCLTPSRGGDARRDLVSRLAWSTMLGVLNDMDRVAVEQYRDDVRQRELIGLISHLDASRYKRLLARLTPAGRPPRVGDVEARVFGARLRDVDDLIARAFDRRLTGDDERMLLLVGEAMVGKSRAGAHALAAERLREMRLLIPLPDAGLGEVEDLVGDEGAVLWLDNVDQFFAWLSLDLAQRWQDKRGLIVAGTVRRTILARLQGGEMRRAWEVLTDDKMVEQIRLPYRWDERDQARLIDIDRRLRKRVVAGEPLGEILGAAPELLKQYRLGDHDRVALVDVVMDWSRAGAPVPLTEALALALWLSYVGGDAAKPESLAAGGARLRFSAALDWATTPPDSGTNASLVRRTLEGLTAEDYITAQRIAAGDPVRDTVWWAVLDHAQTLVDSQPESLFYVGSQAADAGHVAIARAAWETLAEVGDTDAQFNLGLLLATVLDPPNLDEAGTWWTRAAEAGDVDAQYNLWSTAGYPDQPPGSGARPLLVHEGGRGRARGSAVRTGGAGHTGGSPGRPSGPLLVHEGGRGRAHQRPDKANEAAARSGGWTRPRGGPPLDHEGGRGRCYQSPAQSSLGLFLATLAQPPDLEGARHWYTKAAEAGSTKAQYRLAVLLATRVAPMDLPEARHWYTKAIDNGHPDTNDLGPLLSS